MERFGCLPDVVGPVVVFSVEAALVLGTVLVAFVALLAAKRRKEQGVLKEDFGDKRNVRVIVDGPV